MKIIGKGFLFEFISSNFAGKNLIFHKYLAGAYYNPLIGLLNEKRGGRG